jgi:uncharacterized protein YjbI with pentapeptide repeats
MALARGMLRWWLKVTEEMGSNSSILGARWLNGAKFIGANLSRANLTGAQFITANLTGSSLRFFLQRRERGNLWKLSKFPWV